jgi:hypothetical protein
MFQGGITVMLEELQNPITEIHAEIVEIWGRL